MCYLEPSGAPEGDGDRRVARPADHGGAQLAEVAFYSKSENPYGIFCNLYQQSFVLFGHRITTAEHGYHAMKFVPHAPDRAAHLLLKSSPYGVARLARKWQREERHRADWKETRYDVMGALVAGKLIASRKMQRVLLGTDELPIRERTDRDPFWGRSDEGTGADKLGKLLMELRTVLRDNGTEGVRAYQKEALDEVDRLMRNNHDIGLLEALQKVAKQYALLKEKGLTGRFSQQ